MPGPWSTFAVRTDTGFTVIYAYYYTAEGYSTPPDLSWTDSGNAFAQIHRFGDVDYISGLNLFFVYDYWGSSNPHTADELFTLVDNSRVIYIDSTFGSNVGLDQPASWTELLDNGSDTESTHNTLGSKIVPTNGDSSGAIEVNGGNTVWHMLVTELSGMATAEAGNVDLIGP